MKFIYLIFLVCLLPHAYSADCKVYGISDSPQSLSCKFRTTKISLKCLNDQYYLNESKVDQAFHYEVEEGPVPLVFKAPEMQLTVVIESKTRIEGELELGGKISTGKCHF